MKWMNWPCCAPIARLSIAEDNFIWATQQWFNFDLHLLLLLHSVCLNIHIISCELFSLVKFRVYGWVCIVYCVLCTILYCVWCVINVHEKCCWPIWIWLNKMWFWWNDGFTHSLVWSMVFFAKCHIWMRAQGNLSQQTYNRR